MITYDPDTDRIVYEERGKEYEPAWESAEKDKPYEPPPWQPPQDLTPSAPAAPQELTPAAPQAVAPKTPGEYAWGKPPVDYAGRPTYGGTYNTWVNDIINSYKAPDPGLYPELFAAWNQAHAGEPLFNAVHGLGPGGTFTAPGGKQTHYYDLATQAQYPSLNLMPPATAYFNANAPGAPSALQNMPYPTSPAVPGYPNYPGIEGLAPTGKLDYSSPAYQNAFASKPIQDAVKYFMSTHNGAKPSQAAVDELIAKYLGLEGGQFAPTVPAPWTQDKLPYPAEFPRVIGAGSLYQKEPWHPLMNRMVNFNSNFNSSAPSSVGYSPAAPAPSSPTSFGVNRLPQYLMRI